MSVAVDCTHSWTGGVAAVEIAAVTHTEEMDRWTCMRKEGRGRKSYLMPHMQLHCTVNYIIISLKIRFLRNTLIISYVEKCSKYV